MPIVAGLFAIPRIIINGLKQRTNTSMPQMGNGLQTRQGMIAVWKINGTHYAEV